ncbi:MULTISPECIES: WYL domain-containing protein [Sorangium]|uniref:WYL domain-containing protein n=1 Tax=Sorangium TaxID=39643 RepID=UPI003D9C3916
MRADRLLSLMLLLQQAKGRQLTAEDLARRLHVSARTIYRDLDALSSAGVPVYANRGPNGGIALLEGWQTSLTGLTQPEVQALSAVAAPGALADIGLSAALESGLIKLSAALPVVQRSAAEHARQRLHVDSSGWFQGREAVPHLDVLREGVWQDRKVWLAYRDFDGEASERVVDPYGLVIKADRWYLVAGTARGPSVFRGARVEGARLLDEGFARPEGFDLATCWKAWCERFAERRASYVVTLRASEEGEAALRRVRPSGEHARWGQGSRGRDGTRTVTVDFERESIAVSQLIGLGRGVEVLEPAALRARLGAIAEDLRAVYRARGEARARAGPGAVAADDALARCRWPDLSPRYASALRAAVDFVLERFEPLAIVAAGSIVRGCGDASSDLDIFVIHSAPYKQRLQRWFGDVPAEIFVNPPAAVREYWAAEHQHGRPSTAHMLATGFPVLGSPLLDELRTESAAWLARRAALTPDQDTWERYSAATLLEDALDIVERDPAMASALLAEAVLAMVRYRLRARNGVLPRTKELFAELEKRDPEVAGSARRFFEAASLESRITAAHAIADACVRARGFFAWESERVPVAASRGSRAR